VPERNLVAETRPAFTAVASQVAGLIAEALRAHRDELAPLAFLPERRYDRDVFPTVGQYDWLAGQVLYALVRYARPRTIIEFSTGSGYSTSFIALALARNGAGRVHSVDLDPAAQAAAARWLDHLGVRDAVSLHLGDCRELVPRMLHDEVDLLFVDTLHSFAMAEWYLTEVVPHLRPDSLVHIHDVMPPEARVRIHGGPPFGPAPRRPRPPASHLVKRFVWLLLHLRWPNPFPAAPPRETLPLDRLEVFPPARAGELPTIDGNYFEEAVLIRELLRDANPAEAVYLHRMEPDLQGVDPQGYASADRIGRTDARGAPLEWNDALWSRAGLLQTLATPSVVRRAVRALRRRYYGSRH
jgi:predicted O-methyltransferase YrrM